MIACPLASPNAVSCCPVPVNIEPAAPICCGGPIQTGCPPSLTISASPDPLTAGGQVVVSGALLRGTGSGTAVTLWQQFPGQSSPTQAGQAMTDLAGNWSVTLTAGSVMTNRSWYATADGATSATLSEPVVAVVTLSASHAKHAVTLHGTVTPSHAGERVRIQRLIGTHWVTVSRPRLGRHSRFRLHIRLHGKLQAVLLADSRNALSVSPAVTL